MHESLTNINLSHQKSKSTSADMDLDESPPSTSSGGGGSLVEQQETALSGLGLDLVGIVRDYSAEGRE